MNAAMIATRLHGQKSGSGWLAKCQAHDDGTPSLSLRDADGIVLVHCHAGCDQATVVDALRSLGLWPENERRGKSKILNAYDDYTDENGSLLYQVVRLVPKRFLQRYPDGGGGLDLEKVQAASSLSLT